MDLKDSPPFEIYFEKQFLRIINKNTNKYSFFKTTRKGLDTQIIISIIAKIDNSFKSKYKVIDTSNNLNTDSDNSNTNKNLQIIIYQITKLIIIEQIIMKIQIKFK